MLAFRLALPQPLVGRLAHIGREPIVIVGNGKLQMPRLAVETINLFSLVGTTPHIAGNSVFVHGWRDNQDRPGSNARQDFVIIVRDACLVADKET